MGVKQHSSRHLPVCVKCVIIKFKLTLIQTFFISHSKPRMPKQTIASRVEAQGYGDNIFTSQSRNSFVLLSSITTGRAPRGLRKQYELTRVLTSCQAVPTFVLFAHAYKASSLTHELTGLAGQVPSVNCQ